MKKSIADATQIEALDVPGLGKVTKNLKVVHPLFGAGTVVALFEFPAGGPVSHSIGIEFVSVGYKALAPEFAKLQLG